MAAGAVREPFAAVVAGGLAGTALYVVLMRRYALLALGSLKSLHAAEAVVDPASANAADTLRLRSAT
jgi:hypothetical protein